MRRIADALDVEAAVVERFADGIGQAGFFCAVEDRDRDVAGVNGHGIGGRARSGDAEVAGGGVVDVWEQAAPHVEQAQQA